MKLQIVKQKCYRGNKHKKELSIRYILEFPGSFQVQVKNTLSTCVTESEVAQSCPTLCDHVDCSLPGSSDHGILQARVLECVAISFSKGSS